MRYSPHEYQRYATEYIETHPVAAVLLDMGLGKTSITLTALNNLLFDSFEVRRILVIAPLRVARNTWGAEIEKWDHLNSLHYSVAVGTETERLSALRKQADIYLINREYGQRGAAHQLRGAGGLLHQLHQVPVGMGICKRVYGRGHKCDRYEAQERIQPDGAGCAGREDRPYRDQVGEPVREEHGGQPHHGPEAEGEGRGGLFPEGEHLHAGLQRRASHHHHVFAGAGGIPRYWFADGKVSLAYSSFLGYRKGEDGQMEVVPEEAETVRLIYRLFMQGQTPYAIAKYLTDKNIPTPTGKETWRHRTVENILSNEKYKGDARLQKCYTVDFLSKKRKANEGEVPQYYVEGSHDAIIEPAEWQLVQTEIQRRKNAGRSHNCCGVFSAKLKCGACGAYFGSKVWHSNSKYKRTVWQCNAKFKGESRCATPHLYEQRIKELFLEALGILMEDRETVIADCRAVMEALTDCSRIDGEAEEVSNEMEVVAGMIQRLVDENATRKLDQEDYRRKYAGYADRYAALESRMDGLKKERERREIQHDLFSGFLSGLEEVQELPVDFSGKLFHRLVDYATVHSDGRVVFTFRNGAEVSTEI